MKDYLKANYSDWSEFKKAFLEELSNKFVGHDVQYDGFLMTIDRFKFDFVDFNAVSKEVLEVFFEDDDHLIFFPAVNTGKLILNKEDMSAYKELCKIYDSALLAHAAELENAAKIIEAEQKIAYQEYLKKQEAKAEALKAKELEKKYQAKVAKQLQKLETLKPEKTIKWFGEPTTFYEAIGWMAKHATNIKASMPDFMEKWFDGKFDCENKYVVDSKKRTINGNPMQWGLSFRISFDQEASGFLAQRATSSNKKVIDSVSFVWDLIENYGFKFVKARQDIENIRKNIPDEYLPDFEKGLAM